MRLSWWQFMVCFFEIMIQVHADKLLKRALDKFFIGETNSSTWHFYHTDMTRFYESDHSKTVKRLQARNQDWALLTNRWTCEVKWFWISDNNKQCCVIKYVLLRTYVSYESGSNLSCTLAVWHCTDNCFQMKNRVPQCVFLV